jgi:hypothetical protein
MLRFCRHGVHARAHPPCALTSCRRQPFDLIRAEELDPADRLRRHPGAIRSPAT